MTTCCNIVEVVQQSPNVIGVDQQTIAITEIAAVGPQGPPGPPSESGLPEGGDIGNILIKQGTANYDAGWAATLDGGTFN